jgi:sarcosine oxidase subunit gamma
VDNHFLRQSALAKLGLGGQKSAQAGEAGVTMTEVPLRAIVNLRGKAEDKAFMTGTKTALGSALPKTPNSALPGEGLTVIWLSPEEWWIVFESRETAAERALADGLRVTLEGIHAAVVEVGESRSCIRVTGPSARALLSKGCPVDLHASVFGGPGHTAQTLLAKAPVLLHHVADDDDGHPVFEIYVLRSFAEYLWLWLADAAGEFGLAVKMGR